MICRGNYILTDKGLTQVEDIKLPARVFTSDGWKDLKNIKSEVSKETLYIESQLGYRIRVVPEQRMAVRSAKGYKFIQAKNLSEGDNILLLPGENPSWKDLQSEAVDRPTMWDRKVIDHLNGPFSHDLACLLGHFYAIGERTEQKITFRFRNNVSGFGIIFNDALKREMFQSGDFHFHEGQERKFSFEILDPIFFKWLEKNNLANMDNVTPDFLFSSPSKVVGAYLIGYLLGLYPNTRSYTFDFKSIENALRMQLIFLREGIITNRTLSQLACATEKSKHEFDRLFAKAKIYDHAHETWDKEPFQLFFDMKVHTVQPEGILPTYELEIDGSEGVNVNGYYCGV